MGQRVAVISSGNGGQSMAAYLAIKGFETSCTPGSKNG